VVVCEVDPLKALEAVMEGDQVLPVAEAARVGELFVTVTGNRDALTTEPLPPGVHPVPAAVDERVARHKLAAIGVRCDDLTAAQEA
jgi:S-adenosylhomocysteine hydrolase